MSDVNVAPSAPASAPSAPPANEVVVDPNPVSSPQPVGPQAPPKPVDNLPGSEHRPQSRREVIQRAFEKAQEEGRPGPAKPRVGHNQPPEPTEKLDLKKPPPKEIHREQGRFARAPASAEGATAGKPEAEQTHRPGQQQPGQARQHAQLPETAPYRAPPPRFSERAKGEWAATPEGVRGDIYRMHHEVDGMHRHYQADKQVMDTIRPFHRLATSQGTSLDRALNNYVNMENKLRQDVVGGLDLIVANLNLRTPDGRKLGLRDVAYHILNQSPEQHKLTQNQNSQAAHQTQIGQLHQMVSHLAHGMQRMQNERQFVHARSAVDQFADAHPRFDELGDLIQHELQLGFDLNTAYRRAELLRPGSPTRAAQTRTPSAQTRSDKSISGAPESPSNGTERRRDKQIGRREAISNAIRRVNGGV